MDHISLHNITCQDKETKDCTIENIVRNDDVEHFEKHWKYIKQKHSQATGKSACLMTFGIEKFLTDIFQYIIQQNNYFPINVTNCVLQKCFETMDLYIFKKRVKEFREFAMKRLNTRVLYTLFLFGLQHNLPLFSWKINQEENGKIVWKNFAEQFGYLFQNRTYNEINLHEMFQILTLYDMILNNVKTTPFEPVSESEFLKIFEMFLYFCLETKKMNLRVGELYKMFKFFFEKNWINFNSKDEHGNTPFLLYFKHSLFKYDQFRSFLSYFWDNKVNVFQHNFYGQTISYYITFDIECGYKYNNQTVDKILVNVPTFLLPIPWEKQRLLLISHLHQDGAFQIFPYEIILKIFEYSTESNFHYYENVVLQKIKGEKVRKCQHCNIIEKKLLYCAECLAVSYCSKECQIKHWKHVHKSECNLFKEERIKKEEALERRRREQSQWGPSYWFGVHENKLLDVFQTQHSSYQDFAVVVDDLANNNDSDSDDDMSFRGSYVFQPSLGE